MSTELARVEGAAASALEAVVMNGDLGRLTAKERVEYVERVCSSLGLNPLTRPFDYIQLNGKLTLYARKDATEQLRRLHGVSIVELQRDYTDDLCVVVAKATSKDGRCDVSTGAVPLGNLKGEARANAIMKAETKAKRRVTLSICGLGILDEMEVETIPGAAAPVATVSESRTEPAAMPPVVVEAEELPPSEPPAGANVSDDELEELSVMLGELDHLTGKTQDRKPWTIDKVRAGLRKQAAAKKIPLAEAMNRAYVMTGGAIVQAKQATEQAK